MDLDIISGLAQGLQSGIGAYGQAKERNLRQKSLEQEALDKRAAQKAQQDMQTKQYLLEAKKSGLIEGPEGLMRDPDYVAQSKTLDPLEAKFKQAQIDKIRSDIQQASSGMNLKNQLTPGQKAIDTKYAEEYADWTTKGKATVEKNLAKLKEAIAALEAGKVTTNRFKGMLPDLLSPSADVDLKENVQSSVNDSLKATLGAQFTEKEGQRIIKQAYNPSLPPEQNIKRIAATIQEIEKQAANRDEKLAYFDQYGTLKGYTPGVLAQAPQETNVARTKPSGLISEAVATPKTSVDIKAVEWARKNPKDPRSKEILRRNGVQ